MFDSRAGNVLVILYALLTIGVPAFSLVCFAPYCAPLVVVPILPWVLIIRELGLSVPFATYPLFVLLNVVVFYFVGATLEHTYHSLKEGSLHDKMLSFRRKGTPRKS